MSFMILFSLLALELKLLFFYLFFIFLLQLGPRCLVFEKTRDFKLSPHKIWILIQIFSDLPPESSPHDTFDQS